MSDYYNYDYIDEQANFWSVRLTDSTDGSNKLTGYISKTSDDGKKLYDILKDAKDHMITVELQIDDVEIDGNVCDITKFVSDNWVY